MEFRPSPDTQPFAVEKGPIEELTQARGTYVSPTKGFVYAAHIRAPSDRAVAPFALEHQPPLEFECNKPHAGSCKPIDGGVPFAIDPQSAKHYISSATETYNDKGRVFEGKFGVKLGDSQGGVPYATDFTKVVGKEAKPPSPRKERDGVPWALHSGTQAPLATAAAGKNCTVGPKKGNTQPW